jgi:hypothetical protein
MLFPLRRRFRQWAEEAVQPEQAAQAVRWLAGAAALVLRRAVPTQEPDPLVTIAAFHCARPSFERSFDRY